MVRGYLDRPADCLIPPLDMQTRLAAALEDDSLPPELLQIVALTQEALILLNVETTRFKPSSVVKVHKLSAVRCQVRGEEERLTFILAGAELQGSQGEGCRCYPKDVH
jgi:hypothetical protein